MTARVSKVFTVIETGSDSRSKTHVAPKISWRSREYHGAPASRFRYPKACHLGQMIPFSKDHLAFENDKKLVIIGVALSNHYPPFWKLTRTSELRMLSRCSRRKWEKSGISGSETGVADII
jgi:hypothetical protein